MHTAPKALVQEDRHNLNCVWKSWSLSRNQFRTRWLSPSTLQNQSHYQRASTFWGQQRKDEQRVFRESVQYFLISMCFSDLFYVFFTWVMQSAPFIGTISKLAKLLAQVTRPTAFTNLWHAQASLNHTTIARTTWDICTWQRWDPFHLRMDSHPPFFASLTEPQRPANPLLAGGKWQCVGFLVFDLEQNSWCSNLNTPRLQAASSESYIGSRRESPRIRLIF